MAGIPWEQHITFLDDPKRVREIRERVREGVCACSGHPAILCYSIGNEIPASIVRWHGRKAVEAFLRSLFDAVKAIDPEGLTTYVNFPTTEFLFLALGIAAALFEPPLTAAVLGSFALIPLAWTYRDADIAVGAAEGTLRRLQNQL
jgi:beta-galactosidase/beta-glucuronidase